MIKKEIITIVQQYSSVEQLEPIEQEMVQRAMHAARKAYAPYSQFQVGACVLLSNGSFFEGNNQENAAYPSGLCAERVAMFYANSQFPEIAAVKIAIVAYNHNELVSSPVSPCGSCRQVLLESEYRAGAPLRVILVGNPQVFVVDGVKQLLPLCFEPSSLNR